MGNQSPELDDEFFGQKKVSFDATGDVQLWTVAESGWVLPLHCTPVINRENKQPYWIVNPALIPSLVAGKKIAGVMGALSVTQAATFYTLRDSDFRRVCVKCEGVTPEYYLRVPTGQVIDEEQKFTGIPTHEEALSEQMNRLATFLAKKCQIVRIGVIRTVLRAIEENAAEWMVDRGEALDLGLFRVHALPYRRHWKEIYSAFFGFAWMVRLRGQTGAQFAADIEARNMTVDFQSRELVELHGTQTTVRWTLEVTPARKFTAYVDQSEHALMERLGPEHYASSWAKRVRGRIGAIIEVFSEWLDQACSTGCVVHQSVDGGRQILVAKRISLRRLKEIAHHDSVARSIAHPRGKATEHLVAPPALEAPNADLYQVPTLPPPAQDVREGGGGDGG